MKLPYLLANFTVHFLLSSLTMLVLQASVAQQDQPKKEKESLRAEEGGDYYRKWLQQDVIYIITEEEASVFTQLTTDEERDAFIEQFWARRDPDSSTSENEYKIEFYRRILYANENFTAGVPGWKTDRGRIYIKFGPPDEIETMPAGGSYHRERKEGGGFTSVFPFERWWYRRIEGVGDDIELEFVDDKGGGLYELTTDPQRKDELLYSGFMGPTLDEIEDFELTGSRQKQYRVAGRRFAGDLPGPYRNTGAFETEKDRPFSKLIVSSRLDKPPAIRFKDLETAVSTRIHYDAVFFRAQTASFRVSSAQSLVTIAVEVPHSSLTFQRKGGLFSARAEVLGQLSTLSQRVEGVFEELIGQDIPEAEFMAGSSSSSSVFQKQLALRPGLYKLRIVVKDVESGKLGTVEQRLEVAETEGGKLSLSSLILAHEISPAGDAEKSRFEVGRLKVVPRLSRTFRKSEPLGFYFQIYQFELDQSSLSPELQVEFAISPRDSEPDRWRDCSRLAFFGGNHSTVARLTSLEPFQAGDYTLRIRVRDEISGQTAATSADFTIEN